MKVNYLLIPSGVALITDVRFSDDWFLESQVLPDAKGIKVSSGEESFIMPFDVVDHLIATESVLYLYVNDSDVIIGYDNYVQILRELVIETRGGSRVLAQQQL